MSEVSKIALITGANKGIGFAIARQLGAMGITILVGARDQARGEAAAHDLREQGIAARALLLDVTRQDTIDAAAAWIEQTYGKLDILVNNDHRGYLTPEQGARAPVAFATLAADGPSGGFFTQEGVIPW